MKPAEIKKRLLEGIDKRLDMLYSPDKAPYPLHDGHWIRDLITMRAYLLEQDNLEPLVNNLPK